MMKLSDNQFGIDLRLWRHALNRVNIEFAEMAGLGALWKINSNV